MTGMEAGIGPAGGLDALRGVGFGVTTIGGGSWGMDARVDEGLVMPAGMTVLTVLSDDEGAVAVPLALMGMTKGVGVLGLEAGWKPSWRDKSDVETAAIVVAARGRVGRGVVSPGGDMLGELDCAVRAPPVPLPFPLLSTTRLGVDMTGETESGDNDKLSNPGENDDEGGDRPLVADDRLPGDASGGEAKGDDALLGSLLMAGRTGRSGNGRTLGCGRCVRDDEPIRDEYSRTGVDDRDDGCDIAPEPADPVKSADRLELDDKRTNVLNNSQREYAARLLMWRGVGR